MYKINVILQILNEEKEIGYKFPYKQITYKEVCEKEKQLIKKYGRRITNDGPLTNLDSGGRGGMKRSIETCQKISNKLKGKPSLLKGKTIGPYSNERKESIKKGYEKYKNSSQYIMDKETRRNKNKGRELTEEHKKKISNKLKGRSSPMKGRKSWNSGKTKKTDIRIKEAAKKNSISNMGRVAWNKGIPSDNKGKTYEEIYGEEKAKEMKEIRKLKIWITNGIETKKILKTELDKWISKGWARGRSDIGIKK